MNGRVEVIVHGLDCTLRISGDDFVHDSLMKINNLSLVIE